MKVLHAFDSRAARAAGELDLGVDGTSGEIVRAASHRWGRSLRTLIRKNRSARGTIAQTGLDAVLGEHLADGQVRLRFVVGKLAERWAAAAESLRP